VFIIQVCAVDGIHQAEKNKENVYCERIHSKSVEGVDGDNGEHKLWTLILLTKLFTSYSLASFSPTGSSNILQPVYASPPGQSTSLLYGSVNDILPFLVLLCSSIALFNKARSITSSTSLASSFSKDLFNILREMLLVKGKDTFFNQSLRFDDELGLIVDKRKEDQNEKQVLDVRIKGLVALIGLTEKKGVRVGLSIYMLCVCFCVHGEKERKLCITEKRGG
jgi:hypothetical protein